MSAGLTSFQFIAEQAAHYATIIATLSSVLIIYLTLRGRNDTIRTIPGPPSPSWIFGHMLQLLLSPTYGDYEFQWQKLYGPFYRVKGCFGQQRLMISDPIAMQYILNSQDFHFGPNLENIVRMMYGTKSVMGETEENHKRLRAALNLGFTAAAVRNYQPVFAKAAQTLSEELEASSPGPTNICPLLSLATLSTISEAVLGYSTQDLGEDFMLNNYRIIALASSRSASHVLADAIGARLPKWVWTAAVHLPTPTFKSIRTAKFLADRVGAQVLEEKTEAARKGLDINTDLWGQLLTQGGEKTRNALTKDEIIAQTAIIMISGQDTSANTMVFGLLELAKAPKLQEQLRAEIHETLSSAGPGNVVQYDNMLLLNAFIKESLRMYPAEALSERMAIQDTVIPLSDGVTTSTGHRITRVPVRKGQICSLAIGSYQRLESRWGPDAGEFNPSRWLDGKTYKGEAVGPYANLLSFLGGPRVCLGWRFAILEMQVFLCELVGKFSFALSENDPVQTSFASTLLPTTVDGEKGAPMFITRIV
ncbi:cytochrome P450 [Mycena alexandri]|uniref:Cytochrome P450 n=1 Tax=Mycena alexandri TaxID=1745969 RepID=A0AAD6X5K6_9AGAR|nr:cytochrome P450 [Mycena alexandri]